MEAIEKCPNCTEGYLRMDDGFVFPCGPCMATGLLHGDAALMVRSIAAEVEEEERETAMPNDPQPTCGSTHPDSFSAGLTWSCSLPAGHAQPHSAIHWTNKVPPAQPARTEGSDLGDMSELDIVYQLLEKRARMIDNIRAERDAAIERAEKLEHENETLRTVRSHVIQNASCEHMQANTQRSIVLGILRDLELPMEDWNAESLVRDYVAGLRERAEKAEAEVAVYLKRIDEAQARMTNLDCDRTELLMEMDSLCGPICPHDGKRAVEHDHGKLGCCWTMHHTFKAGTSMRNSAFECAVRMLPGMPCRLTAAAYVHQPCEKSHPAWPEGEAWLAARRSS